MLSLSQFIVEENDTDSEYLTGYFKYNQCILVHGESGSGKTIFTIQECNKSDIKPILVDYDNNSLMNLQELNADAIIVNGSEFMKALLSNRTKRSKTLYEKHEDFRCQMSGAVLIIDTWHLFNMDNGGKEVNSKKLIDYLIENYNMTIILISHTLIFSGKDAIPDMNDKIYKHIDNRFYIRKTTLKSKIEFHLVFEKLRGYTGDLIKQIRKEEIKDA